MGRAGAREGGTATAAPQAGRAAEDSLVLRETAAAGGDEVLVGRIRKDTASDNGIALYLSAPLASPLPAGTAIEVRGIVDERYAERVLRIEEAAIAAGASLKRYTVSLSV